MGALLERNTRVFNQCPCSVNDILERTACIAFLWAKSAQFLWWFPLSMLQKDLGGNLVLAHLFILLLYFVCFSSLDGRLFSYLLYFLFFHKNIFYKEQY